MGRPEIYTQELADLICAELTEGKSLRSVCRQDGMPNKATVFRWLRTRTEFLAQYTRAKEEASDALIEEILDIADDSEKDFVEHQHADGSTDLKPDYEHINRSRLRVDTRKWIASKMKPKKYGEKVETNISGTLEIRRLIIND